MKLYPIFLLGLLLTNYANCAENAFKDIVLESVKGTGFNGTVLVSRKGKIILHENIGFADKEKTARINNHHLYSPGSVGKEFTTVSIMQLVQQGRLKYQDKISKYFNGLPSWAEEITVENVLSHTSGLPKVKWERNIDTSDAIEQIKNSQFQFEPGAGYLYSNLNVVVRALVVEKITGTSYSDFLKKSIFDVADMKGSYQQISNSDISSLKVQGDYPTYLLGVTMYVTPLDLLKFEDALSNGSLVPWDEIKKRLPGDRLSNKQNRAYFDFGNFYKNDQGKLVRWAHDGSNPSHHTIKHHDFMNEVTMILMSSDGNKSTLYKIRDVINGLVSKDFQDSFNRYRRR